MAFDYKNPNKGAGQGGGYGGGGYGGPSGPPPPPAPDPHAKIGQGRGDEYLDEFGFPMSGKLPDGYVAPQYQMLAERQATRRNDRLAREAQLVLDQGLSAMGQYRPGVSQQLTSGFYGGQANVLMGNRMGAPDLMHYGRQDAIKDSQKHATKMGIISAGAGIISAGIGALPGLINGGGAGGFSPRIGLSFGGGSPPGGGPAPTDASQGSAQAPSTPTGAPAAGGQPSTTSPDFVGPQAQSTGGGGQGGGQPQYGAGFEGPIPPPRHGGADGYHAANRPSAGGGGGSKAMSAGGGASGMPTAAQGPGGVSSVMGGVDWGGQTGDSIFSTPASQFSTGPTPVTALSGGSSFDPDNMFNLSLDADEDLFGEDFNDQAYARVGFMLMSDIPFNPLFSSVNF